jgi:hypothetical protein
MNDQLQSRLADILTGIQAGVSKAGDFAVNQLSDVAQQYVLFGRLWNTAVAVALFGISAMLFYITLRKGYLSMAVDKDGEWTLSRFLTAFIGSIGTLGAAFIGMLHANWAMLAWIAPKIYLLKKLAELMR